MPLSQLASKIYETLRVMVPDSDVTITYRSLVDRLGPLPAPNQNLNAQDPRLNDALNEIVHACRGSNLPALPAIVVGADNGMPGSGYYSVAYPQLSNQGRLVQEIAWGNELREVRQTHYPQTL